MGNNDPGAPGSASDRAAKEEKHESSGAVALSEYKVAAVQAAPEFLDKGATVEKACRLIGEAGREGAALVVFPETWVPGYPFWLMRPGSDSPPKTLPSAVTRKVYSRLYKNAVDVPGPETERLGQAARKAGVIVAIGVHERTLSGTLFNTIVFINKDGSLLGKHRKLVPTGGERTIWGQGDGSTLGVFETAVGRLGGLICWENWMPLARYAQYSLGEQVHVAVWPAMVEGFLLASRAVAHEGRVFVVAAATYLRRDLIPPSLDFADELDLPPVIARGGSAIIGPDGTYLEGPIYDRETILYANINMERIIEGKQSLDVVGHYARPEVFRLHVNRKEMSPLIVDDMTSEGKQHD